MKGQNAHGPGALGPFEHRIHRAIADLTEHFGGPLDALHPSPQITRAGLLLPPRSQRQGHLQTLAVTLDQHGHGFARQAPHSIDQLLPVLQRLSIQLQQTVAHLQTGRRGRPLGIELCQHRLKRRTPWANTQGGNRIGLIDAAQPVIQGDLPRTVGSGARLAHRQAQFAPLPETAPQLQIARRPARGRLTVARNYFLTCLQTGHFGQAAALDRTDDRAHLLAADHRHQPEEHQGQQEVGHRPRRDYGDALTHRLAIERLLQLLGRYVALALVEHLHVATQGNGRDYKLGALAVMPTQQGRAKAHGKAQNLDPAAAGDPEMAELMECYQYPQRNQGTHQHIKRTHQTSPRLLPPRHCCARLRARLSAANTVSRLSTARTASAFSTLSMIRAISGKRMRRSRKAATATSLAALSMAGAVPPASAACRARRRQGKRCSSGAWKSRRATANRSSGATPESIRSGQARA